MAKKRHTRRIKANNGNTVELTSVTRGNQIIEDERNGVVFLDGAGNEVGRVPMSAGAVARTASWFQHAA